MNFILIRSTDEFNNIELSSEDSNCVLLSFATYLEDDVEPIIKHVISFIDKGYELSLGIEFEKRNYTAHEFSIFLSIREKLKPHNVDFRVYDRWSNYSLEECIKADSKLDKFILKLKESSLSPLEKFLVIYRYLCRRDYNDDGSENIIDSNPHVSRDIISITNTNYIVCEGYALLMNYFCENVGIKSLIHSVDIIDRDYNYTKHANNLVLIHDDKYNVHGLYYSDSTWDSASDCLTFSLVPLQDVNAFRVDLIIRPMPSMVPFYRVKQFRMFEDDFVSEGYDGNSTIYTPWRAKEKIDKYRELAKSLFLNKRKEVIDQLISIFKSENVNEDIYDEVKLIPFGANILFFISLLLVSSNNEKVVRYKINELKRIRDVSKDTYDHYPYFPRDVFVRESAPNGIYHYLEDLKSYDFENIDLSENAISSMEFEDPRVSYLLKSIPIINYTKRLLKYPKVKKDIEDNYPLGEPIPVDTFKKAYYQALLYEGNNEEFAKEFTDMVINETIKEAHVAYSDTALNCFRKEDVKINLKNNNIS